MMICLLVANLGGIDPDPRLKYVLQILPDTWTFDSYYFDETNFPSRNGAMSPRLQAKIPKMLGWQMLPDYDYYIWLDSSFRIGNPHCIQWFVDNCSGHDIAVFPHPKRNSIRSELAYMQMRMQKGDRYLMERYGSEPMEAQVQHYLSDPEFQDNSLFAAGAFIYSKSLVAHSDNALKEWFFQNVTASVQDQLSLPWVLQKFRARVKVLPSDIFQNEYIEHLGTH
jgi:hypothetical protein